ncbi:SprT family protein [Vagococcus hydrophili]|uniref:SprT family protein n=1 Tax=Vagococcus hydrophili TaxID=2714947 RepID=A0A6G8AXH5_9ENTE|nr:SprT family protein [Vagococcus hydrophili]QIL49717.1 SprT family protein [Vagococcus hydrophili]
MTNEELQKLVEEISLQFFKKPFNHQASFNKRLKTTGGRYHLSSHQLDFNPLVLEKHGEEELIGVIKHELCHYHLHLENRGYQHKDQDFKQLLKATGGSRFVKTLVEKKEIRLQSYQCQTCGALIKRKRRVNTEKFGCQCGGTLKHLTKTK